MVQLWWKVAWGFLKKLNIELLYGPAIPLLGMFPKELKAETCIGICTPIFIAELFIVIKGGINPSVHQK